MEFGGLSYFAVILAAVASFLFGGVWYNVLSRHWMAAAEITPDDIQARGGEGPIPLVVAFVAQVVMAWVLAGLIGHLGEDQVTLRNGLISAAFVWAGFVLMPMVVNHTFQGSKRMLTLIDSGHWLGVLLIQGAVIGIVGGQ